VLSIKRYVIVAHVRLLYKPASHNSRLITAEMNRSWCSLRLLLLAIQVVISQAGSSPDKTIHIGYLLQYFGRAGAINVAIEHAQNDGLLRDYNFRYNRLLLLRYDRFSSKSSSS